MRPRSAILFFTLLAPAYADTLALRNGTSVTGSWVGFDAGQVSFLMDGQVRMYPRSDVSKVTFGPVPGAPLPKIDPPPAPLADPPATAPQTPKNVSDGDTKAQVVAAYGQPDSTSKIGAKEIYIYKGLNLKVTFVDGKVTDIQ